MIFIFCIITGKIIIILSTMSKNGLGKAIQNKL